MSISDRVKQLYQLVSTTNTALAIDTHLSEGREARYTYALKIDEKQGTLVLDVISVHHEQIDIEEGVGAEINDDSMVMIGKPNLITYTHHEHELHTCRSYYIPDTNVLDFIINMRNAYREQYKKQEWCWDRDNTHTTKRTSLFRFNDMGLANDRNLAMRCLAKRALGEHAPELIDHLAFRENSYIIPICDSNNELKDVTLEYGSLFNEDGVSVIYKYTAPADLEVDHARVRNLGGNIEIAPLNHNAVRLDPDYITMILNNDSPTQLLDIYKDITESSL